MIIKVYRYNETEETGTTEIIECDFFGLTHSKDMSVVWFPSGCRKIYLKGGYCSVEVLENGKLVKKFSLDDKDGVQVITEV